MVLGAMTNRTSSVASAGNGTSISAARLANTGLPPTVSISVGFAMSPIP